MRFKIKWEFRVSHFHIKLFRNNIYNSFLYSRNVFKFLNFTKFILENILDEFLILPSLLRYICRSLLLTRSKS